MASSRGWVIVLNNYTDEDVEAWKTLFTLQIVTYSCFEKEIGKEGTPHLQGYAHFPNQRTFGGVKKLCKVFHHAPHLEAAVASATMNRNYCAKDAARLKDDGLFWEVGTVPGPGKRNDLSEMKDKIKSGEIRTRKQVFELASGYQAQKMGEIGLQLYAPRRTGPPKVEWIYGPTGTGKSEYADSFGYEDTWKSGLAEGRFFFEGYAGQSIAVFEDFRAECLSFRQMLRVLDRYNCSVEIKGGSVDFAATHIIITSCHSPDECYGSEGEDLRQLLRRITSVRQMFVRGTAKKDSPVLLE